MVMGKYVLLGSSLSSKHEAIKWAAWKSSRLKADWIRCIWIS